MPHPRRLVPLVLFTLNAPFSGSCGNDLGFDRSPDDLVDGSVSDPSQAEGLPCEIQELLATHCQGCHATQPTGGAPMSLVTYRDLTVKNGAGVVIAQRALARMSGTGAQMPPAPAPAVPAAAISAFEAWVNGGTPTGTCGADPGAAPDPGPNPFDDPVVCTSGRRYDDDDDDGSPLMHPGRACITCHSQSDDDDAPRLTIGGTVYPTGHEPNDCNGATGATVEVTGADGKVTMLPVNAAGNFLTTSPIMFPIRVAVVVGDKRRAMGGSPPRGDCNSCHTRDGANGAPGRIVIPY